MSMTLGTCRILASFPFAHSHLFGAYFEAFVKAHWQAMEDCIAEERPSKARFVESLLCMHTFLDLSSATTLAAAWAGSQTGLVSLLNAWRARSPALLRAYGAQTGAASAVLSWHGPRSASSMSGNFPSAAIVMRGSLLQLSALLAVASSGVLDERALSLCVSREIAGTMTRALRVVRAGAEAGAGESEGNGKCEWEGQGQGEGQGPGTQKGHSIHPSCSRRCLQCAAPAAARGSSDVAHAALPPAGASAEMLWPLLPLDSLSLAWQGDSVGASNLGRVLSLLRRVPLRRLALDLSAQDVAMLGRLLAPVPDHCECAGGASHAQHEGNSMLAGNPLCGTLQSLALSGLAGPPVALLSPTIARTAAESEGQSARGCVAEQLMPESKGSELGSGGDVASSAATAESDPSSHCVSVFSLFARLRALSLDFKSTAGDARGGLQVGHLQGARSDPRRQATWTSLPALAPFSGETRCARAVAAAIPAARLACHFKSFSFMSSSGEAEHDLSSLAALRGLEVLSLRGVRIEAAGAGGAASAGGAGAAATAGSLREGDRASVRAPGVAAPLLDAAAAAAAAGAAGTAATAPSDAAAAVAMAATAGAAALVVAQGRDEAARKVAFLGSLAPSLTALEIELDWEYAASKATSLVGDHAAVSIEDVVTALAAPASQASARHALDFGSTLHAPAAGANGATVAAIATARIAPAIARSMSVRALEPVSAVRFEDSTAALPLRTMALSLQFVPWSAPASPLRHRNHAGDGQQESVADAHGALPRAARRALTLECEPALRWLGSLRRVVFITDLASAASGSLSLPSASIGEDDSERAAAAAVVPPYSRTGQATPVVDAELWRGAFRAGLGMELEVSASAPGSYCLSENSLQWDCPG